MPLLKIANEKKQYLMLWGAYTKKRKQNRSNKHLVLESGHPSPLSANQGKWFGNKHFSTGKCLLTIKI
jgi:uracil-DNA glycosylase